MISKSKIVTATYDNGEIYHAYKITIVPYTGTIVIESCNDGTFSEESKKFHIQMKVENLSYHGMKLVIEGFNVISNDIMQTFNELMDNKTYQDMIEQTITSI